MVSNCQRRILFKTFPLKIEYTTEYKNQCKRQRKPTVDNVHVVSWTKMRACDRHHNDHRMSWLQRILAWWNIPQQRQYCLTAQYFKFINKKLSQVTDCYVEVESIYYECAKRLHSYSSYLGVTSHQHTKNVIVVIVGWTSDNRKVVRLYEYIYQVVTFTTCLCQWKKKWSFFGMLRVKSPKTWSSRQRKCEEDNDCAFSRTAGSFFTR